MDLQSQKNNTSTLNARPISRILFAIWLFAITASLHAETLSLATFRIELADGWVHSAQSGHETRGESGGPVEIHHPDGNGTLQLLTFDMPVDVGIEVLRNMTNVDPSIQLTLENWGDYSGYQYDYSEGSSFFRQWWLALETEILLIVYDSTAMPADINIELIDQMVNSIKK